MDRISELEQLVLGYRDTYYNGTPEISDDAYDALEEELRLLDPSSCALVSVGSPIKSGKKVKLPVEMGSLEKENTVEGMRDWGASRERTLSQSCLKYTVSEKIDGSSLLLIYKGGKFTQALTRGSGHEGEDVTHNVKKINFPKTLPVPYTGEIRTEVYLKLSVFEEHFSMTSNARNTASGLIRSKDGDVGHLDVLAYHIYKGDFECEADIFEILEQWGFQTPYVGVGDLNWVLDKYAEYVSGKRKQLDHTIDGLVVTLNDRSTHEDLGSNNLKPKFSVALKFPPSVVLTEIVGFTWEVSENGKLIPVAQLNPTPMDGITLKNVTMHNLEFLEKSGAIIGSTVKVQRSGDVIPHFEGVVGGEYVSGSGDDYQLAIDCPTHCPMCSNHLQVEGVHLVCPNPDCISRTIGNIKNYVKALGILQVGDTTIEELVKLGILGDPADLYTLTLDQFMRVARKGEKHYKKMMLELEESKEQELHLFLAALNIPDGGRRSWATVIQEHHIKSLDDLFKLVEADFVRTTRIGAKRAHSMYTGLLDKYGTITKLLNVGVHFKLQKEGNLSGLSFCFTGSASRPRKELEALVTDRGGTIGSVTKNLNYLVQADPDSGSVKSEKARKLGVSVISEDDFFLMLGGYQ